MNMSRDSTSWKKSSGDCLKLQSRDTAFWVKWCYLWITAFSQVVQKH